MAREQDYYTIMNGLQELDFRGNPVPCDLVLIGESAFPLAINPRGQVLMAASHYGQGRVVVLGHEEYLTRFPVLIKNAIMWLMPCTGDGGIVGIQKKLRSVDENLNYCPIKTELGDFRNGLAVYITDAYSVESCAKDLIAFIKAGGGLIIAGQAWHWTATHPQENTIKNFPGNKVCSVAGIYFSEHYGEVIPFPVPRNIPSNWIAVSMRKDFKDDLKFLLEGVSEFDVRGGAIASEVMVHGPLAFPIAVTPDGKAFIAGAYYGQGRVILVSHEGFMGRDSLSTFLINAIKWLVEGHKGVIGILPSLQEAHTVLSKSGLDCQLTGFRKDLSVYVCTSYSDAQCAEIQDFVAEGGGLMIGGHAWYWAQTHCGCNVMTDYAGNRILNKMGLCLLDNTLCGGVYKAPEIENRCKEVYHFRSMLHRFAKHVRRGHELTNHEQSCLKHLGNDCASYLRMRSHDSAAYTSMVALLSDIVKKVGVPQVCSNCPVQSEKDHLMLHVGTEVYKVSPDPDALIPYIIKDRPNLPTVSNARVRISANTTACEEWISTGLYLSPGMKTYIAVPPEIVGKNWQVQLGCQMDNIGASDVLKRAPVVHERFPLDTEMVQVCNLWGGLIYLITPPQSKVDGVEIVVQVSVQAPYFKSGETSVADWVDRIRQAPAPWAELEFENIIITLESEYIRNLDCPDKVAKLWDTIMRSIADLAARPGKFPRFMHAGYPIMMHSTSAPELVNVQEAYKSGLWGPIHELGHNQQCGVWEFPPHTTECPCNLWSVYIHEEVLGLNRSNAHPQMTLENRQARTTMYCSGGKDLNSWSMWTALETYMQLQEKFGWDAFKKVFTAYHDMNGVPNDNAGKMNLYAETFSKVVNLNLCPFFKAWGWPIQTSTQEKISHLPEWSDHPMVQYT
ncbi:TRPM8 channel-associated factor homolog isoform X2 [Carassius carassius]|uniref:TRPM8 channel-associated factor homolog isoform X2 n=1 Tax=Carassius carassius TaxID=217509 RepID=UPI002868C784|nr:TRPM8 channel-associated factor homolog isoform X2 [Carassius carassius]